MAASRPVVATNGHRSADMQAGTSVGRSRVNWDSGTVIGMVASACGLSNAVKIGSLGIGAAVGVAGGAAAHALLPNPETERELAKRGISTMSDREAIATFAPMAFVGAAAVGTGIAKRSETAAITTASLGAAAMLSSTGTSAMVGADGETADEYIRTLGLMSTVAAGGFAVGAMTKVPLHRAKLVGLGLAGVSAGGLAPSAATYVAGLPAELGRSYQHRDG